MEKDLTVANAIFENISSLTRRFSEKRELLDELSLKDASTE